MDACCFSALCLSGDLLHRDSPNPGPAQALGNGPGEALHVVRRMPLTQQPQGADLLVVLRHLLRRSKNHRRLI